MFTERTVFMKPAVEKQSKQKYSIIQDRIKESKGNTLSNVSEPERGLTPAPSRGPGNYPIDYYNAYCLLFIIN